MPSLRGSGSGYQVCEGGAFAGGPAGETPALQGATNEASTFTFFVIERSMAARKNSNLRLVSEQAADPAVAALFEEIRQTLGVPLVAKMFQALAAHPRFLELHWQAVKPALAADEFYRCAARLRAQAYTWAHNYFRIPDLCHDLEAEQFSDGAKEELGRVVDLFFHLNPVLLMLLAIQTRAFGGPVGKQEATPKPTRPPQFPERPVMVREETAPEPIRKIFEEIRRTLRLPLLPDDYEALARWPGFLRPYWEVVRGMAASPLYQQFQLGLQESAQALAGDIPVQVDLSGPVLREAGLGEAEIAEIAHSAELLLQNLSLKVFNSAVAKIAVEGGNEQQRVA